MESVSGLIDSMMSQVAIAIRRLCEHKSRVVQEIKDEAIMLVGEWTTKGKADQQGLKG